MPIELPTPTRSQSDRLLEYWLERARAGSGLRWAMLARDDGDFVGAIGLNALGRVAELAYHLIPDHWHRGLAAEASRAVLSWAFAEGTETIECHIEPSNARSIALATRLGFAETTPQQPGTRHYVLHRGDDAA